MAWETEKGGREKAVGEASGGVAEKDDGSRAECGERAFSAPHPWHKTARELHAWSGQEQRCLGALRPNLMERSAAKFGPIV